MRRFLIEIPVPQSTQVELRRALYGLQLAQQRLAEHGTVVRRLLAGSTQDGHLIVCIEAPTVEVARQLLALALLPAGRLRELTVADA